MSKQVLFWMSIDKKDVKADGLFYKEKKIYKSLRHNVPCAWYKDY